MAPAKLFTAIKSLEKDTAVLLLELCLEVREGAYTVQGNFHKMECMSALLDAMLSAWVSNCRLLIKIFRMDGWMGGWSGRWMGWAAGRQGPPGRSPPVLVKDACRRLFIWLPFGMELDPSQLSNS